MTGQWKAEYDAAAYVGLRAVADELLAALESCQTVLGWLDNEAFENCALPPDVRLLLLGTVRAAIAKAKGGAK